MLIAQISDLHVAPPGVLIGGADSSATLARCVRDIAGRDPPPDLVLATGDLVEEGTPEEYRRLRDLLAPLAMPVYVIPGNHDDRSTLRRAFADHHYLPAGGGSIHYALDGNELGLIALDTTVPGAPHGALDEPQCAWLEGLLQRRTDRAFLVFMHHPPIMTGIRCLDDIALEPRSVARLADIAAREPRIERIVCGHVHRSIQARWKGTLVSICPSTAYQGILNLRNDDFDAATGEPPAYQLHYWNGTELVTHTVAVTSRR